MNKKLKGFLKVLTLIVLMAITGFVASLITEDTGGINPELVNDVIDKLVPILMGILTGLVTTYLKTSTLETTVKASFDSVAIKAEESILSSEEKVEKVVNMSINTSKDVTALKDLIKEQNAEIRILKTEVQHVKNMGKSISNVEEIVKIAFMNDPNLVKNGIAKQIAKVGVESET